MSDNGIIITNPVGKVIVDGNHSGYKRALRANGSVSCQHFVSDDLGLYVVTTATMFPTVITTVAPPILAIKSTSIGLAIGFHSMIGQPGNWTGMQLGTNHKRQPGGGIYHESISFEYEIYVPMDYGFSANASEYGLVINNAAGRPVFHSMEHNLVSSRKIVINTPEPPASTQNTSQAEYNRVAGYNPSPYVFGPNEYVDTGSLGYYVMMYFYYGVGGANALITYKFYSVGLPDGGHQLVFRFASDEDMAYVPSWIAAGGTHSSTPLRCIAIKRY